MKKLLTKARADIAKHRRKSAGTLLAEISFYLLGSVAVLYMMVSVFPH